MNLLKYKKTIIFFAVLITLILTALYFAVSFKKASVVNFGISFSTKAARGLGFDPKVMYLDILNDLKPQKMRLVAYWDEFEIERGKFNFQQMDELLLEADKRNVEIVLALGHKQPRWPECHQPNWFNNLSSEEQDQAVYTMIRTATEHFKKFSSIKIWQIENEPYFDFGVMCGMISEEGLKEEIKIVKSIDNRPVMVTDSGEKGNWMHTLKSGADIMGVTMYRVVVDKYLGYEKYPIPPIYYRMKAGMLQKFGGERSIVGVELQAEPWVTKGFEQVDLQEQLSIMNPKVLRENLDYARSVGFADNYLWGVEWWYWLTKKHNDWGMWQTAKEAVSKP